MGIEGASPQPSKEMVWVVVCDASQRWECENSKFRWILKQLGRLLQEVQAPGIGLELGWH